MGRLAIWRLRSHEEFGGTWLSDYVPNRLGGFIGSTVQEAEKPGCDLIGEDGNIFHLLGIAANILREHDREVQVEEMKDRVFSTGSYEEALRTIGKRTICF